MTHIRTGRRMSPIWIGAVSILVTAPSSAQQTDYSLSDLLQLAGQIHPSLQAARSEASASRGAWLASRRWTNPELAFEVGRGDPDDGSATRRVGSLTLTQYFENPLQRHYRLRALEAEADAALAEADEQALDVAYEVTRHFFAICRLAALVDIAGRTTDALELTLRLVTARAELGEAPEREVIRLRVETLRARNMLNTLEAELLLERRHLSAFLGGGLPDDYRLAGEYPFEVLAASEEELRERLLASHPALLGAAARTAAADSRTSAARASRLPDPVLSAYAADEMDGSKRGLGVALSIPLWDFQGREIARNQELFAAREHALDALRVRLRMELAMRYTEVRITEQSLALFRSELLDAADRSLRITEAGYRAGEIPLLEYLDAQRTYQSVLGEYEETLYSWHMSRAALRRAVGGDIP